MNGAAPYPVGPIASTSVKADNGVSITMDTVRSILELFPDADPEYLRSFIEENKSDVNFVNATVYGWLERPSYPRLAEAQKAAIKRKFQKSNLSVEEFLEMFPDPNNNYFQNKDRLVSASYQSHVKVYVPNQFRLAYKVDLEKMMVKHKFHLTPIMNELNNHWSISPTDDPLLKEIRQKLRVKNSKTPIKCMPQEIDELFYKEKFSIEMKDRIKQFKHDKETERTRKIAMAKQKHELMTCDCCFEDEVLAEDMLRCSLGHLFCRTCIQRLAEVHIGQDKYQFPCLDAYCETEFPPMTLRKVLTPNMFINVVRKMQAEEIRRADIPDLETCPHCTYCIIMPDVNVKIFQCLNPECLKITCRLCKEANHLPLRCDEIEKKAEIGFRTHVEDRMTEALLRTCPHCKRRIIKEDGCNKMICTCGQRFCYVCREPIADYKHFENGRCPLFSNDDELHRLEVQEGAKRAKQDYVATHPEAQAMELKNDPSKAPFGAVQRRQQLYEHGAMPMVDERGQIVFQRDERGNW